MVLQLTVFWYIGAVLGHVCLGLGVLALVTMLLSWVFFFPQWGLGVCVVLWSVGCKSIQFLVRSFIGSAGDTPAKTRTHVLCFFFVVVFLEIAVDHGLTQPI